MTPPDVTALRAQVKEDQVALRSEYAEHGDACRLLVSRCAKVDDVLTRLWREVRFPASAALAAVGGYGRGELYPSSDVDLLILLPAEPDAALQARLETLIGCFWDIGLEIGHSVRTIEECLAEAEKEYLRAIELAPD
ncbi:MAG TPA: nucleotidyltransferase domain-containing protein, partial [Rhodocyclaceae bacterium]|nr:nucleotidyltransferase domain-containing protein [Rhodocyclaceae bacterium]